MDTSERLAAYAAGELGPDEAAAVEAQLAGDVALRRELSRIRQVDQLLGDLREVEVPAEFRASLRATLGEELATHAPVVDLSTRMRRQRWLAPAAAAAVVAVVAGVGLANLGGLGGSDDAALDEAAPEAAALAPADDADTMAGAAGSTSGQPVYAEGGSYDRETIALLANDLAILSARDVASQDPAGFQFAFLDQLAAAASPFSAERSTAAEAAPGIAADAGEADVAEDGATSDLAVVDPVTACVPTILEQDRVPLFADLGRFEGSEALVVVLGAPAADGSFSRLEFWVLDPIGCDVLHFAQR